MGSTNHANLLNDKLRTQIQTVNQIIENNTIKYRLS